VDISISARHGDLPVETQQRIEEKVQKLPRYYERVTSIAITVDLKDHQEPEVEIKVSAEGLDDVVAKSNGGNVISATDACVHKMERQLKKSKEKITDHRKPGIKHLEPEAGT
jgi:putative sigma-54 modulation protein